MPAPTALHPTTPEHIHTCMFCFVRSGGLNILKNQAPLPLPPLQQAGRLNTVGSPPSFVLRAGEPRFGDFHDDPTAACFRCRVHYGYRELLPVESVTPKGQRVHCVEVCRAGIYSNVIEMPANRLVVCDNAHNTPRYIIPASDLRYDFPTQSWVDMVTGHVVTPVDPYSNRRLRGTVASTIVARAQAGTNRP